MENKTETFHKPILVNREGHIDLLLMAKAYSKLFMDIVDYVFINHQIPHIQ